MTKRFLYVLIFTLLMGFALSAQAQTEDIEPHPLFELLAIIPDNLQTRDSNQYISYVDYDAVENGRATPVNPETWDQFDLILELPLGAKWINSTRRIRSGPSEILQYLLLGGADMQSVSGVDFFEIDHAITFGAPPAQGTIFQGQFDVDAIETASLGRDYEQADINGVTAWCWIEGCDEGLKVNIVDRNPSNIFDPSLGRNPPFLILNDGDTVAYAFALEVVEEMASASLGETRSLADAPDYQAMASAITDPDMYTGDLVQVNIFPFDPVNNVQDYTIFETREDYEEFIGSGGIGVLPPMASDFVNYGDLPTYQLAALVDRQEGETQIAMIALVYASEESAQTAAQELTSRLASFSGEIVTGDPTPFASMIDGAQVNDGYVYASDEAGLYVAVASVSYPLPEENFSSGEAAAEVAPGILYRRWMDSIFRRAFSPLWQITLPDWAVEE
jgi:hypothetical protein